MNVNSTVLTVMNFVVTNDWIAVGSDLNSGKGVAVDVVVFD